MELIEQEYIAKKGCYDCGEGQMVVTKNPRGFDTHMYLCKTHFVLRYPKVSQEKDITS